MVTHVRKMEMPLWCKEALGTAESYILKNEAAKKIGYFTVACKRFVIRDFMRAAVFFLMVPCLAALSIAL